MDSRPHSIAQAVLAIVHRLLGTPLSLIGRVAGSTLIVRDVLDVGNFGVARGLELPLGDTLASVVERTREVAIVDDAMALQSPFERDLGLHSGVAMPLVLRDGTVVGMLCGYDRVARGFNKGEVEIVADLARAVVGEMDEVLQLGRAVELERARLAGLLARGLAHDFGNVVSSALANVRSLVRILGDDARAKEPIEEITASLEAGRELVARLRDVGRSEGGNNRLRGTDPTAIASKVVAMARALFKSGVRSRTNRSGEYAAIVSSVPWVDLRLVPPDQPVEIRGDDHALEQALLNLVLNARDAIGDRGGRVTVRVMSEHFSRADLDHPWRTAGEWAVLAVDDDGPGIVPEMRNQVFEPGFSTKGERGTGLGLFLVRTTATAHGGGVIVEQSPEGGARVCLYLPVIGLVARPKPVAYTPITGPIITNKRDLILVADDERGLRRACARELTAAGLAVAEAASRAAALEIVDADPKRIVAAIIDHDLGDGSGDDVVARLRALNPTTIVIRTSGASDVTARSGEIFLEKPFDLPSLVLRLTTMLSGR